MGSSTLYLQSSRMIKNITSIILVLGLVSSEIVSQYALLIPKVPDVSAKYYSNSYSGGGSGYNPGGSGYNSGSNGGSGYNPGSNGGSGYNPGTGGGSGYNPGVNGVSGYNP